MMPDLTSAMIALNCANPIKHDAVGRNRDGRG
jgi:hypothetical protein